MPSRKELLRDLRDSLEYWKEVIGLEVLGDVQRLMEDAAINQAELADRLGSSEAYVSKILNANTNFTLQTLIKLARALESVLHVRIARPDEVVRVSPVGDVVRNLDSSSVPARASVFLLVATEAGSDPDCAYMPDAPAGAFPAVESGAFQPGWVARA